MNFDSKIISRIAFKAFYKNKTFSIEIKNDSVIILKLNLENNMGL